MSASSARPSAAPFRLLAGGIAAALAFSLPGLAALPAAADTQSNTEVSLTVTVTDVTEIFDEVTVTATVTPINGGDCAANPPTSANWIVADWTSGGFTGTPDGTSMVYTHVWGPAGNNQSPYFEVTVSGGCVGSTPITAGDGYSSPWWQFYTYGVAQQAIDRDDWVNGTRIPGVTVDLMEVSAGEDGDPVATTTTDSTGWYTLYAPLTVEADIDRTYKVRFTLPGGEVYYENHETAGPASTSPTSWEDAAVGGPRTWQNRWYSLWLEAAWSFEGIESIVGTAWQQDAPLAPYDSVEGVVVDLVTTPDQVVPDATTTTDAAGWYILYGPIATEEEATEDYLLRFTYPDDSVVFYSDDTSTTTPSPADAADATLVSPSTWSDEIGYDARVGFPSASSTDTDLVCDEDGEESEDLTTSSAVWYDVCLTDATVEEAEVTETDRSDAFDLIGELYFGDERYQPTSADYTIDTVGGTTTLEFVDEDVLVLDGDDLVSVDIHVTRTITGSWIRWEVEVFEAGTSTPSDLSFTFEGGLGSDGSTRWRETAVGLVSFEGFEDGDPILIHRGDATWTVHDGDDDVLAEATGSLEYEIGLVDYTDCVTESAVAAAIALATAADFGDALSVEGGECPPGPTWAFAAPEFVVGEAFDETFPAPAGGGWDWAYGGSLSVEGLPDGLDWEIVDGWEDDTAPSLRIFGTPTEAGLYEFTIWLWDDWNTAEIIVTGTVVEPAPELTLDLGIEIGEPVAGGLVVVKAKGLEDGADYVLDVRSTPTVIADGVVPSNGTLSASGQLPQLGAGWHTITFASSWADGASASARLWILVGADGTLQQVSETEPVVDRRLATTGSEASGALVVGAAALLLGAGLLITRRRRTA